MSGKGGGKGGAKPSANRKGYRNKSQQLEAIVKDKVNALAKLQVSWQCMTGSGGIMYVQSGEVS
jgi:hypothetical protein